jgi:hypothetical protein
MRKKNKRGSPPGSDNEFLGSIIDIYGSLLDVIFDAIEQGALINNQARQILEQFGKIGDRPGYFGQLSIASSQVRRLFQSLRLVLTLFLSKTTVRE